MNHSLLLASDKEGPVYFALIVWDFIGSDTLIGHNFDRFKMALFYISALLCNVSLIQ